MKAVLIACLLVGASTAGPVFAEDEERFPRFNDPGLMQGREVWLGNCKACHATGIADAPRVDDKAAWQPRLAKARETLHQHALNGFFGPMGSMMPPRGGNEKLSDEQVKAAVDYMIAIVSK